MQKKSICISVYLTFVLFNFVFCYLPLLPYTFHFFLLYISLRCAPIAILINWLKKNGCWKKWNVIYLCYFLLLQLCTLFVISNFMVSLQFWSKFYLDKLDQCADNDEMAERSEVLQHILYYLVYGHEFESRFSQRKKRKENLILEKTNMSNIYIS